MTKEEGAGAALGVVHVAVRLLRMLWSGGDDGRGSGSPFSALHQKAAEVARAAQEELTRQEALDLATRQDRERAFLKHYAACVEVLGSAAPSAEEVDRVRRELGPAWGVYQSALLEHALRECDLRLLAALLGVPEERFQPTAAAVRSALQHPKLSVELVFPQSQDALVECFGRLDAADRQALLDWSEEGLDPLEGAQLGAPLRRAHVLLRTEQPPPRMKGALDYLRPEGLEPTQQLVHNIDACRAAVKELEGLLGQRADNPELQSRYQERVVKLYRQALEDADAAVWRGREDPLNRLRAASAKLESHLELFKVIRARLGPPAASAEAPERSPAVRSGA